MMDKDARKDPKYSYRKLYTPTRNLKLINVNPLNKIENHNAQYAHEMKLEALLADKFLPCGSNCLKKNTPFGQVWYEKHKKFLGYTYVRIK